MLTAWKKTERDQPLFVAGTPSEQSLGTNVRIDLGPGSLAAQPVTFANPLERGADFAEGGPLAISVWPIIGPEGS